MGKMYAPKMEAALARLAGLDDSEMAQLAMVLLDQIGISAARQNEVQRILNICGYGDEVEAFQNSEPVRKRCEIDGCDRGVVDGSTLCAGHWEEFIVHANTR